MPPKLLDGRVIGQQLVWHIAAAIPLHFGALAFAAALLVLPGHRRVRQVYQSDIPWPLTCAWYCGLAGLLAFRGHTRIVLAKFVRAGPIRPSMVAAEEQQLAAAQKKLQSGGRRHIEL